MDWKGRWIFKAGEKRPTNYYLLLRRSFQLDFHVVSASVAVSADAFYKLYINGNYVGRGPARSSDKKKFYDQYEVAAHLRRGENVLAAVVYTHGVPSFETFQRQGGFILQAEFDGAGGEKRHVATDGDWRVMPGAAWRRDTLRISHCRGFSEHYDGRREPAGWMIAGFDDSSWERAFEVAAPEGEIWPCLIEREIPYPVERMIPPAALLRYGGVTQLREPVCAEEEYGIGRILRCDRYGPLVGVRMEGVASLTRGEGSCNITPESASSQDIYLLFDFGREVSGYPFIEAGGQEDLVLDLGWAEGLDSRGGLDLLHGDRLLGYGARVIMPAGRHRWEAFQLAAFRYLQITLRNVTGPVNLHQVGLRFTAYPAEFRGSFSSSDERLNRIFEISRYAVNLCMDDAFMDCPSRERGQWLADAVVEAMIAFYAFGDSRLFRKALIDYAESQTEEGRILPVFPAEYENWIPGFACLWGHGLRRYVELTGDDSLNETFHPVISRLVGYFEDHLDDGMLAGVPGWMFFDWQPELKLGQRNTLMSLFFFLLLRDSAYIAKMSGWEEDALRWESLAEKVRISVLEKCWDPVRMLLSDNPLADWLTPRGCARGEASPGKAPAGDLREEARFSEQTNGFALYSGFLTGERAKRVAAVLAGEHDLIKVATPYFGFWVVDALFRSGEHAAALKQIRERWWPLVLGGATTTWEHFRKTASLCHGWSGGPAYWLLAEVLGVNPQRPGFEEILIRPYLGDLEWASGVVPTPRGDVSVHVYRGDDGSVRADVSVPPGVRWELDEGRF